MSWAMKAGQMGTAGAASQKEGELAYAEGKASQKLSEFNARQLEREARSSQEAAAFDEQRVARAEKISLGRLVAKGGKSGIAAGEGSPIEVLADEVGQFAIDRALTLRGGLVTAQRLKTLASIEIAEGRVAKMKGRELKRISLLRTIGGALGSGSSMGGGMGGSK